LFVYVIENDDEKRVVAKALDCVANVAKLLGPAAIHPYIEQLMSVSATFVKGLAICQQADDDDDPNYEPNDEDEEESESLMLIQSTCECVTEIAKIYGPLFSGYFGICETMLKFQFKHTVAAGYREEVIGVCAEVSKAMGLAIRPNLELLMAAAMQGLQDTHAPVRSNSAYLSGLLCEYGGEAVVKHYPKLLELLSPLFLGPTPGTIDNACGAVGRMIQAFPQAVPLPQVLPVWIAALPLREDYQEAHSTYGAIF